MADKNDSNNIVNARAWRWQFARYLAYSFIFLLFLFVAILGGVYALLQSEDGRNWLVEQINKSETVHIDALEGDFWNDVVVREVTYRDNDMEVYVDYARWRWTLGDLRHKKLTIPEFAANIVTITLRETAQHGKSNNEPPTSLTIPIAIDLRQANISEVVIDSTKLKNIVFSLNNNGSGYVFDLRQLVIEQDMILGSAQGTLTLSESSPFVAEGHISFQGSFEEYTAGFESNIDGHLRDLHLTGYLFGDGWFIVSDGRFDVFADEWYAMLHEMTLRLDHVDISLFSPQIPRSDLSVMLTLEASEEKSEKQSYLQGSVQIENAMAGKYDARKIPLKTLAARFEWQEDQFLFYDLDAWALGDAHLTGLGWLREDSMRVQAQLNSINLAALISSTPETAISGEMWLTGSYDDPQLAVNLTDRLFMFAFKSDLALDNLRDPEKLMIRNAALTYGNATMTLTGDYFLNKEQLTVEGKLDHIDLSKFDIVESDLNIAFSVDTIASPELAADIRYQVKSSTAAGYPLSGEGAMRFVPTHFENIALRLRSGETELTAHGALGTGADILSVRIEVPDVVEWYQDAHGRIVGEGTMAGEFPHLSSSMQVSGEKLMIAGVDISVLNIRADGVLTDNFPFTVKTKIEGIQILDTSIDSTELLLDGSLKEQKFHLEALGTYQEKPFTMIARAQGALVNDAMPWHGELSELTVDGFCPVKLISPISISASPREITLGQAAISANNTDIRMTALQWRPDYVHTSGTAENISLKRWMNIADIGEGIAHNDLTFSGNWRLTISDNEQQGEVIIERQSGDVELHIASRSIWQPLYLNRTSARFVLDNEKIDWNANVESSRYGKIEVRGDARLPKAIPEFRELPFDLYLTGIVPDLSNMESFSGGGIKLTGDLKLDVEHHGSLANGQNSGQLTGAHLSIHDDMTGVTLDEGVMSITLKNDQIVVEEFTFKGGRGEMKITGGIDLSGETPQARFAINADRMRIIRSQEMLLVVSGRGDLSYDENGASLEGNLRANYGNIRYRDTSVPTLSSDVVIVGEETESSDNIKLARIEFDVDLGNNFRLRGYGVDTKVKGALKFRARPGHELGVHGVLQTYEGSYRAYGQNLGIQRGIISFLGSIDNPALDILAIRENSPVNAGVSVKGTAQRPRVDLYSEPKMATNETLSWLLFDHGSDSIDGGDSAILFHVLNSMFASSDSGTLTDELFGGLVDEISVGSNHSSDGEATQVVTVSKKLTRDISIALEKSFNGLQDAIRLSWRFARRWSLTGRFGVEDTSANVHYSIRY
ncbi:MAG: translocation/assembly module TamB domain-containing protein [Burkholderiales bacterium]|jgi:translocation and assembly module TamB|nr:translocation/assembly module TamB domain-containing protein [Burkholderiales bacterium]